MSQIASERLAEVEQTRAAIAGLDVNSPEYATKFIDGLLTLSCSRGVSDVHIQPIGDELDVRWRVDGVLQELGRFSSGGTTSPITRLKVLAELLTYRQDAPQEGRIRGRFENVEMRVSTFPTLDGERAVVRLFAADDTHHYLTDLGYPTKIRDQLRQLLFQTSGALLITGPAGSGKTTTAYACLRQIVEDSQGGRAIVSLEDPIEVAVPGVSQSQANPAAGFTLSSGLRSLLRQDPEVILVGEVRDRETAEVAMQASLTGQLVLTTFHAGTAASAISRLSDMGIEPYLLRSGTLAILGQRLVRRLCTCATVIDDQTEFAGLAVDQAWRAKGCRLCDGRGYRGRAALVELLIPQLSELGRAILSRDDAEKLEQLAIQTGMIPLWQRALTAVEESITSPAEVRRVLGFSKESL
jgi:type II secretory ATPase GspE/PulE/Tfp pilus assembly ATPase PilB-like protein